MNVKPTLARPHLLPCFVAALLSAVISAGLLGAVGGLFFYSAGIPCGSVVAAERTCRDHALVSEEECLRVKLAGPIAANDCLRHAARFE